MKRNTQTTWILIIAITALVFCISLASYFHATGKYIFRDKQTSFTHNGVFILDSLDIQGKKLIPLRGEVEFYWNQLLSPKDFEDTVRIPDKFIYIPGTWNGEVVDGKKLNGIGFATYHFKIKVKDDEVYGFKTKEFFTAFSMWANGKSITSSGTVGTTKETSKPCWERKILYVSPINHEIDVVLQISNFDHRKGGAASTILFGQQEQIRRYMKNQFGISVFVVGILIILSLLFFSLTFFVKDSNFIVFFSFLCLIMSVRLMFTGEKTIYDLFHNIPWPLVVRIEYISYFISIPLQLYYGASFFKQEFSTRVLKAIHILTWAFSLFVVFSPMPLATYAPIPHQFVAIFSAIYAFVALTKAVIRKRENAILFLCIYFFFFIIISNDILLFNNLIHTVYLLPFGFLAFVVFQSIIIAKTYSSAFEKIEKLTSSLEAINRDLEKKVVERTLEIEKQKDEIEAQAQMLQENNLQLKELNSFKTTMTGMIIHDLKNPLNIILNFSKDERIFFAARRMQNLVNNILDMQRDEESQLQLKKKEIRANEIIDLAIDQIGYLQEEQSISIVKKCPRDLMIFADEELLVRVLVNLLTNALKFSPFNGFVTIECSAIDNEAIISVTDNGPGISEEKKPLIFEKFGQIEKRQLGKFGSTGIGLTFCKMVVEAHGGQIGFDSVPDEGSTFWIKLQSATKKEAPDPLEQSILTAHKTGTEIAFTTQAIKIIGEHLEELKALKIYEVSKIMATSDLMKTYKDAALDKWIAQLNIIVWSGNPKAYNDFLSDFEKRHPKTQKS